MAELANKKEIPMQFGVEGLNEIGGGLHECLGMFKSLTGVHKRSAPFLHTSDNLLENGSLTGIDMIDDNLTLNHDITGNT